MKTLSQLSKQRKRIYALEKLVFMKMKISNNKFDFNTYDKLSVKLSLLMNRNEKRYSRILDLEKSISDSYEANDNTKESNEESLTNNTSLSTATNFNAFNGVDNLTNKNTVMVQQQLVLSLFSGAGLLDKAFKEMGFIVVSAGDIILNHDIRDFTGLLNKFDGIIGGSPCTWFSKANRDRSKKHLGVELLNEYKRVVLECQPKWAVLENVAEVPDLVIPDYSYQRIDINQSWFEDINRLRHIQFYSKDGLYLHWDREVCPIGHKKCDGAALASDSRSYKELLRLQGLPADLDYPDFTVKGKKKLIGNGVPLSMGRIIAKAVLDVTDPGNKISCDSTVLKRCLCDCKRIVSHQGKYYDSSCRKRAQRKRDITTHTPKVV